MAFLRLPFLPVLLSACGILAADFPRPTHFSLGPTGGILLQGAQAEVVFESRIPIQIQAYRYDEFQGIFPETAKWPDNGYRIFAVQSGYYWKGRFAKLGLLTGLAHAEGVVRGDFLRADTSVCGMGILCFEGVDRYYEEIRLDGLVVPIKVVLGVNLRYVGLSVGPQWYLHRRRSFGNLAAGLEVGMP